MLFYYLNVHTSLFIVQRTKKNVHTYSITRMDTNSCKYSLGWQQTRPYQIAKPALSACMAGLICLQGQPYISTSAGVQL